MSESSCNLYDRSSTGFRIQSVSPTTIRMLENTTFSDCIVPHDSNQLTLSVQELLQIRQTISDCEIPVYSTSIDAPTQLAILKIKNNDRFPWSNVIISKGLTGDQGYTVGYPILKDMEVYTNNGDSLSSNVAPYGVAIPSDLTSCAWHDWDDDIFDDWGFFYIFDVATRQYYFPIFEPENLADGVFSTQSFEAFGRTYTITSGYPAEGIFKFDILCSDDSEFIFGAYGDMGSDDSTINTNLTQPFTLNGQNYTLYYNRNVEDGDLIERFFSYFIPYQPELNNTKTYTDFLVNDDELSLFSVPLRYGVTVYFSKKNDVKDWVINDLTFV